MSAIIYLRRMKPGISRHTYELDESELKIDWTDVAGVDSCIVDVEIDANAGEVIVRGQVSGDLKLECARCLEPFDMSTVFQLALIIKLAHDGKLTGPESESSDDYFIVPDTTEEFDLAPIIAERVILSLPLKPLCSDSCEGLCPNCGVNRNLETCECTNETVDERLSVLAKLKETDGGN
ncbi:MAG: DUF177 domain-containing protein [Candidatus Zixiibacteriota bacterium]